MYLSQHTSFLFVVFFKGECQDSDDGKTDRRQKNCKSYYDKYPIDCGKFDDDDFSANSMCCACKGTIFLNKLVEKKTIIYKRHDNNMNNSLWFDYE